MPKFFVPSKNITHEILIEGEDFKHISKVLRLKEKDKIIVTDDKSYDYYAEISRFEKSCLFLNILDKKENTTESNLKITLFQAIPKSGKMESIITQNVELGIFEFIPVITKFCVPKIKENFDNKVERWNKISEAAAKQSMRGIIPRVHAPLDISSAIDYAKKLDLSIVPYEKEEKRNLSELKIHSTQHIGVFIGSEGGFALEEIELFIKSDILPFTLGSRILRTETAGVVTSSILMHMGGAL